jgi:hypothetical protein
MNRIASLVLAACLPGCVALAQLAQQGGSSSASSTGPDGAHHVEIAGRTYRVGPYWGPECDRIGAPKEEVTPYGEPHATMGKQPNLSHDPADQILRLVCVESILSSADEPARNTWVMQHFRFDELAFDHFTASMMLVQCLEAGSCLDEGGPPEKPDVKYITTYERPATRPVEQYYEVAMMRWYADRVDPAQVAKRLATLPLPPAAQQTYLALLDRARTRVVAVSNELVPEIKRVFVDLPAAVYQQRAAARARSAKVLARLASLTERVKAERTAGVTDDTMAKLRQLRVAYHASCHKDCTHDAIFRAITEQLFWGYATRGDGPGAMIEAKLLDHPEPSAAQEIADEQGAAISRIRGRLARVSAAREQGIDADTARATARGATFDLGEGRYVYRWDDELKIDWLALVPDAQDVGSFEGKVAELDRKGDHVLVRFHDQVSSWEESTNCYETGRIDSISADGHINYREECNGSTTKTERHKVAPVVIPASEAAGLHGGDELFGFARGDADKGPRTGRIWIVKRGSRVARLADVPL